MGKKIFLLAVMISLLRISFHHSHWILMLFQTAWFLTPIIVKSRLSNNFIEFLLIRFSCSLDMTNDWLFDIGISKELSFEFNFIFREKMRFKIINSIIRFSIDKSFDNFSSTVIIMKLFWVLYIFHIRNDGFRVEAMLIGCSKLSFWKLLTFDSSRLTSLHDITWAKIIGLSWVMTGSFLFWEIWSLELFDFLIFSKSKDKVFDILCDMKFGFELVFNEMLIHSKKLFIQTLF